MSSSDKNPVAPAPQEIDTDELDQVVGAGVVVPDARKQEQSEKVTVEQSEQKQLEN